MIARRNPWATAEAREAHRRGCQLAARYPLRLVVKRLTIPDTRIRVDVLICGHQRPIASGDAPRAGRRRCRECFNAGGAS